MCIEARCLVKNCNGVLTHGKNSGTSHISRHAERHQKKGEQPEVRPTSDQTRLNPDGSGYFRFNPKKAVEAMSRYIVHAEKPLNFAEDRKLEQMIKDALEPYFRKIPYKRVRREVQKQYKTRLSELQNWFKHCKQRIAVTSDVWDAGDHNLSYSCLTAHWIDENWQLQKRVLSVRVLPFPHTAEAIYDHLTDLFKEFHIKDRIISISFDNASNNTATIPFFKTALSPMMDGELFHQRCACHILNLVVQSGTSVAELKKIINKYKFGLKFIDSNGKKKQEFRERCEQMGYKKIKIPWDVETRWNSTFRLLNRTMPYKTPIESILEAAPGAHEYILNSHEWSILSRLLPFLSKFFEATVRLSCTYTPTSSALLSQLVIISDWYHDNVSYFEDEPILVEVIIAMRSKFLKYWETIPTLAIIACVLDPRLKFATTADMIATYNANMGLPPLANEEIHVRDKFERLFTHYAEQHRSAASSSRPPLPTPRQGGGMSSLLRAIHRRRPDEPSRERASLDEVKKYEAYPLSADEADSPDFDLLVYWEAHEKVWPVLANIARDIFAIPVSTVPSESCFSACNRVLTDSRTRLGNKMFEALVCLKDWYDAEFRQQDKSKMYDTANEIAATSGFDTENIGTSEQAIDDDSDAEPPEPSNWWQYSEYYM